jgi:pantetheine-phosphate adenylyltransferase
MNPVIAVYPGTFDPITRGHEDIVRRAAQLFDRVIVAVAVAHHKKTMFSLDERMAMVREVFADTPSVQAEPFSGLTRDFVRAHHAKVMVRGVRSVTDFDYELQLAGMNRHLMADVDTVFLTPDARYQSVSSTLVREIATLGHPDDIRELVSPAVHQRLMAKKAST